jgi:hypothetical protein
MLCASVQADIAAIVGGSTLASKCLGDDLALDREELAGKRARAGFVGVLAG